MNIGIDIGGSHIAIGVVDEFGKIYEKINIKNLIGDYEHLIKNICLAYNEFATKYSVDNIGIGIPGIIDVKNGIIKSSNNLNYNNYPIVKELSKNISIPIEIDNDAKCAAIGEGIYGAAKYSELSVMLTIGTGVGGSIIINKNKIYVHASELGHHVIMKNGKKCTCGRNGCFEQYASTTALINNVKKNIKPEWQLYKDINGDIQKINGEKILFSYYRNDNEIQFVVDEFFDDLSLGIENIINIFSPEMIIIGGGISACKSILSSINDRIKTKEVQIKLAELGNNAGLIGASRLGTYHNYRGF